MQQNEIPAFCKICAGTAQYWYRLTIFVLVCVFVWSHEAPSPSCCQLHWHCLWKYDWGGQHAVQQLLLWLSMVGAGVGVNMSDKTGDVLAGLLVSRRSFRGPLVRKVWVVCIVSNSVCPAQLIFIKMFIIIVQQSYAIELWLVITSNVLLKSRR